MEQFIAEARGFINHGMHATKAVAKAMAHFCILRCAKCDRTETFTSDDVEKYVNSSWPECCGTLMQCHFRNEKDGS